MGREIRRVPENWAHPKVVMEQWDSFTRLVQPKEVFRPMYSGGYDEALEAWHTDLAEWLEGYRLWQTGYVMRSGELMPVAEAIAEHVDYLKRTGYDRFNPSLQWVKWSSGLVYWEDYADPPPSYPNPDHYMPEGDWYQLFETVSEGTPLSPPFATMEEVISYLEEHGDFVGRSWSALGLQQLAQGGYMPSGMMVPGGKIRTPEEGYGLEEGI